MLAIVITSVIDLVIILYHGFLDKSIWISMVKDKFFLCMMEQKCSALREVNRLLL